MALKRCLSYSEVCISGAGTHVPYPRWTRSRSASSGCRTGPCQTPRGRTRPPSGRQSRRTQEPARKDKQGKDWRRKLKTDQVFIGGRHELAAVVGVARPDHPDVREALGQREVLERGVVVRLQLHDGLEALVRQDSEAAMSQVPAERRIMRCLKTITSFSCCKV